jgi:hypothetical protein
MLKGNRTSYWLGMRIPASSQAPGMPSGPMFDQTLTTSDDRRIVLERDFAGKYLEKVPIFL